MIYYYTEEFHKEFNNDLGYWCNALGELHYHGQHDLTEEELPEELRTAYNTLWTQNLSSLCYIADFKNVYGIILTNEFDETTRQNLSCSSKEMYGHMKRKAQKYSQMKEFDGATFILGEGTGFFGCHEFIVFLPWNASPEIVSKIDSILNTDLYEPETTERETIMDITRTAYEKYRLDWMINHGHTLTQLMKYMEILNGIKCNPEESVCRLFEDFNENGNFAGRLWKNYDEFMEAEFMDDEYMAALLTSDELERRTEWFMESYGFYVICYETPHGTPAWETIFGEDDMQFRVDELTKELDCDPEDILVFHTDSKL